MASKQNLTWLEVIAEIGNHFPEEVFSVTEEIVPKLLSSLDAREKMILEQSHGINCPRKTLKEIGLTIGVSGNRIAQIRNKARRKIWRRLYKNKCIVNTGLLTATLERIVAKLSQSSSEVFDETLRELLTENKFTSQEVEEFRRLFS